MLSPASPNPPFSWSWTRAATLSRCPRRYYLRFYAAHDGWRPEADPAARLVYRLRQLRTLWMVLGMALHDRAREIATALRSRRPAPSPGTLEERTRSALNQAYKIGRNPRAFEAAPRRWPMLHEVYYGGELTPEYLERIEDRLTAALYHLRTSPIWDEVASLPATDVVLTEPLSHFVLDGVTVWAAPDLAYRSPDRGVTIVDWKAGQVGPVEGQLAVYSLLLERGMRIALGAEDYQAVGVGLADGAVRATVLTPAHRDDATARVGASVREMHALLRDPVANEPLGPEAFPRTRRWTECQRCPFLQVCAPEIERDRGTVVDHRTAGSDPGAYVGAAAPALPGVVHAAPTLAGGSGP